MTQPPVSPPRDLPEQPRLSRRSRYNRSRSPVSWWALFIGLCLGIGGGIYLTWNVFPLVEVDTAPHQLAESARQEYAIAIALEFSLNGDLRLAVERLSRLYPNRDPIQAVADVACDLARQGDVTSTGRLRSVRALRTFYQLQGRSGCADTLIPDVESDADSQVVEVVVPTATPTLPPPPTKTPTMPPPAASPTPTGVLIVPTTPPRRNFDGRIVSTFCDVDLSGIIEVFVQDGSAEGMPGQVVRVRGDEFEDTFLTGLKPERGPAYADFRMEAGMSYIIDMPGQADPISTPITADDCITPDGEDAIKSYRVIFREI